MSPASPPTVLRFGDHCVKFVAPDVVIVAFTSNIHTDEVLAITDTFRAVKEREGRLFAVTDLSAVTAVPRRVRMAGPRMVPAYDALAFVGANFALRVVTEMVMRATRVLAPNLSFPCEFFDDQATALAWLHTQRRALEATHAAAHPR
ncbi:STAS/SEC14 domain-containing protein [Polyangium sp. y55x31]|uniref:STAS/SEC14 domain-containing protein n=1 Tax=Polyangium sp. y55x31 TaxID=3042688 RepID=UPI002482B531|nr:STAS/SEC14 domain-containing protein [Polyangium sp. y55x31]MDI1478562.1 STAS/SEC14 domain-containing protein [Polyangium sp. y55x31]